MPAEHRPGQTLRYWLGLTMREEREKAGVVASEVAGRVKASEVTISRFEKGQTWPAQIDTYLAAYAEFLDVEDPRDFYAQALKRWHQEGERPALGGESPTQRARAAAQRASRRTQQSRDERGGAPRATPKRRGAA